MCFFVVVLVVANLTPNIQHTMNHHFPLREAERSTRLSMGVSVVTGGRGSDGGCSLALSSGQTS